MSRGRDLLRAPWLHFLAIGALLFVAQKLLAPSRVLTTTADAVAESLSSEDILLRDAVALGLDRTDPVVRARLTRLAAMLATDEIDDPAALEAEARSLGLDRSDPVVRRRLAHAMELVHARVGPGDMPDEREVVAYFERNADRFALPASVHFHHIYFARDRDGTNANEAADAARSDLEAREVEPAQAGTLGDAFMFGNELTLTVPDLERRFGPGFAAALEEPAVGEWIGPVTSTYGVHLIWVAERTPRRAPELEAVRNRVVHAILAERSAAKLEQRLDQRRVFYQGDRRQTERSPAR